MEDSAARHRALEERIAAWASTREDVRAAIVVGSRARTDHPADGSSDLDVLLVVESVAPYLEDAAWLGEIDEVWDWITLHTVAGDPEHLVVYAGGARADLVLVPAASARAVGDLPSLPETLRRGMRFLLDREGLEARVRAVPATDARPAPPTQADVEGQARRFWFLALCTAQQIARDDLWWAQSCAGALRDALLPALEWHVRALRGADTWHAGRFIAEWADPSVAAALPDIWGPYDRAGAWQALEATIALYRRTTRETVGALGLSYPEMLDARLSGAIAGLSPAEGWPGATDAG